MILLTVTLFLTSVMLPMATVAEGNETKDLPIVKIGFLNPITGPVDVYAPGWTAAMEIAEDHINSMQSQYNFEIVEEDSGCDGSVAQTAAYDLVYAGVVAVAGAACSGASIGANSILSSYGIPQVSYASSSPVLSDDSSYPGFMRVVPSDAMQGHAISYAMNETGDTNPALLYMTNDYGSGLADSFDAAWTDVVWDCRLDVRLDSLPDFSEQSFNDSISEHPGYPEWCGAIVPENLALDGSEPNLPPAEDLYGENWGGGVRARSETRYVDSWYSQEECSANEGTWDEDYSMCSFPVGCIPEADSQLIYEECLPSQYARYHWSGDYLYIGMPSNSWWIN